MTRLLTVLLIAIASQLIPQLTFAQATAINTYAGYAFEDAIRYQGVPLEYDATLEGGFMWGAGFEYVPYRSSYGIELLYLNQSSNAIPSSYSNDSLVSEFEVKINYGLVGTNAYFSMNRSRTFYSFAGAMLGLSFINSKSKATSASESSTNFAWGLRLGTRFKPSDNISLNFTAQLLSTTQDVSKDSYLSSQYNSEGSASIIQFGLLGGVSYIFGD